MAEIKYEIIETIGGCFILLDGKQVILRQPFERILPLSPKILSKIVEYRALLVAKIGGMPIADGNYLFLSSYGNKK